MCLYMHMYIYFAIPKNIQPQISINLFVCIYILPLIKKSFSQKFQFKNFGAHLLLLASIKTLTVFCLLRENEVSEINKDATRCKFCGTH